MIFFVSGKLLFDYVNKIIGLLDEVFKVFLFIVELSGLFMIGFI